MYPYEDADQKAYDAMDAATQEAVIGRLYDILMQNGASIHSNKKMWVLDRVGRRYYGWPISWLPYLHAAMHDKLSMDPFGGMESLALMLMETDVNPFNVGDLVVSTTGGSNDSSKGVWRVAATPTSDVIRIVPHDEVAKKCYATYWQGVSTRPEGEISFFARYWKSANPQMDPFGGIV